MRKLSGILFIIGFAFSVFAQGPSPIAEESLKVIIRGTIVEGQSNLPVEYATVAVLSADTKDLIAGTTTDVDGRFEVSALNDNVIIEASFIGFETKTITEINFNKGIADLGLITISPSSQMMDEVIVRAEKSQTEFKLDKRVFNVGQDLSSTGASALEVLNNVPSVTVGIEGDIKLRGSGGVQMLINGKPSVIADESGNALGTITADMIEKVEVITNPGAKYDAEGTAGIINIILKKDEKKGLNGSITLNTGIPANHSIGVSVNRRTDKFNLFSQFGVGTRTYPGTFETISRNLSTGESIISEGTSEKNEIYYNFILGTDYHFDDYTVVTLSGSYAFEDESENSTSLFSLTDQNNQALSSWRRDELTTAGNPKWQYELQFKKDFKEHKDRSLLFSAIGRAFSKDQMSNFANAYSLGSVDNNFNQNTGTDFGDVNYTFKLDYTHPVSERVNVEAGAQYLLSNVGNDYSVENFIDGNWELQSDLTNVFNYNQGVAAAYATSSYEGDKWGVKGGLRLEHTNLNTVLENTNENNEQIYTNLFPSIHTSYKVTPAISLQAGYSKRIFRPRMWDLNPFFNIRNNFSVRTGNPDLLPEFSDSYEVNAIFIADKGSLNAGVYHRYTTNVVERITTLDGNVSTSIPLNIGTQNTTGLEVNAKYIVNKKITLNGDANYNYFSRAGVYEANNFDFNADQWSARATAKFKLPASIDFEVTGNYRSRVQTLQTLISDYTYLDLGVRKKFMKGKTVVSLSVRDLFASSFRESETNFGDLYQYNFYQRGRFVTLGVSYGFGKGEAMEFSGSRRRH
ncbi:outer membrane beta-barrel family protein [Portibacter lacus]|uniref:TonB-dependent receptor n=1 Tax=Portibacter lacus TaxID=1099794 RepID=A0AA37SRD4_9BACT|nr:outer membrane beta-barrel family protein [Portibacter lacus]GLR18752.1 TonB-dependent receptor [Portibacter lacus]